MPPKTPKYVKDRRGNYKFNKAVTPQYIVDLAVTILESRYKRGPKMTSPEEAGRFFQLKLGDLEREVFATAYLDNKHRLIEYENSFYGTIDGASVYPREVVKQALYYNAAATVFGHNHPSGVHEPSAADNALTRRLQESLALVDVRVLDHLVVSQTGYVSMVERGFL